MDLIHGLLLITPIHLLSAASPGPDFVLVSQQTLSNGKKAGLLCSLGIALGLAIHIIYSSLGLAVVIANSASTLWVIKILGGSYLIWLGINGLRSTAKNNTMIANKQVVTQSPSKTILLGFLCNALNPKTAVYFVSLFTLVLSQDTPIHHLAIYGLWMMVLQLAWFSFLTVILSRPQVTNKLQSAGHIINRIAGGAMVILGLKVLASRSN
tara:strand:- start:1163 stop:1792 length:630 start_codon:yes stop_codon:yes gene_type:complete